MREEGARAPDAVPAWPWAVLGYALGAALLPLAPHQPGTIQLGRREGVLLGVIVLTAEAALAAVLIRRYRAAQRPVPAAAWALVLPAGLLARWCAQVIAGRAPDPAPGGSTPPDLLPYAYAALALALLGTVVLAPLWEEWLFRGWLYEQGAWGRNLVVNAAVFALVHPWDYAAPVATGRSHAAVFALGLLLTATRRWGGNVWLCVALHAAINGSTVVLLDGGPSGP